jgi:hydroxymethylbilane synthase
MREVIIGSRGSDLALWQAHYVQAELEKLGVATTIKIIKTQGDIIQHLSFDKMEGKGFFTKEIEAALLDKSIDLAVHSHKDLETTYPKGLTIAAVSSREDPSELLLIRKEAMDTQQKWELKTNPLVGTSSGRRKSQLIKYRPDVMLKDLRGNVPTRIDKLRNGDYDAILLARAGVVRLGLDLSDLHQVILDPEEFIPAPAQGVLGLQIREEDTALFDILQQMNDPVIQKRIGVERKILNLLQGGCQLPLGAYCSTDDKVHVAFAKKWEDGAHFKTYAFADATNIAREIVDELNTLK